jgi:Na+/H+ antiporter NhaD/arsenite permease-like protein
MLSPFVAMLLCIALLPFILKRHWEQHYHMVAIVLAIIPIAYYVLFLRRPQRLFQEGRDYISFIALLGSLFVVTGGIHIGVRGKTNPLKNSVFLLCGGLLANVIGNTGASVLLIRPWIRLNRGRYRGLHTAFFIFIMGNVGGGVTPLGPPLLLGYLKGVPFWWVALQCWKPWLITIISLVAIFYALDSMSFRRAPVQICQEDTETAEFVRFKGR